MVETTQTTEIPEVKQSEFVLTTYAVNCPECGEYLEEEGSMVGKVIECMCGQRMKVKK